MRNWVFIISLWAGFVTCKSSLTFVPCAKSTCTCWHMQPLLCPWGEAGEALPFQSSVMLASHREDFSELKHVSRADLGSGQLYLGLVCLNSYPGLPCLLLYCTCTGDFQDPLGMSLPQLLHSWFTWFLERSWVDFLFLFMTFFFNFITCGSSPGKPLVWQSGGVRGTA